jgi:hypothetical protein
MNPTCAKTLSANGDFVLENYQLADPFASFLPGIAGLSGRPLWAFYCNRGQGIAGFGLRDKDGAVMEFHPANKAYHLVPTHGFRTFLRVNGVFHEPFQRQPRSAKIQQRMVVRPWEIELEECHPAMGLTVRVACFTLAEDPEAALIRRVEITNTSTSPISIELLDGLPFMVPSFVKDGSIKGVANTKCGTTETLGVQEDLIYCRSKVKSSDAVVLEMVEAGNFHFALDPAGKPLAAVADPALVFGIGGSFVQPYAFLEAETFDPSVQRKLNFMPCAMTHARRTVEPGCSFLLHSLSGQAESLGDVQALRQRAAVAGWCDDKRAANRVLVEGICDRMNTASALPTFDAYCRQTFLDNCLRGGLPVPLGQSVFHVYFRKHGDMERDYNAFSIQPTPWSQGNGNYRDVNQNRRCDPLIEPASGTDAARAFLGAIQLDGNNPLLYEGSSYRLRPGADAVLAAKLGKAWPEIEPRVSHGFTPGSLIAWARHHQDTLGMSGEELADLLAQQSEKVETFRPEKGYWSDHWTYCLDLIESYASVFPDRLGQLLHGTADLTTFDNPEVQLPRDQRYTLDGHGKVRQVASTTLDPEKVKRIKERTTDAHAVRDASGAIWRSTPWEKLLILAATRLASLDFDGLGVEMVGNRPGWNDALNGLPALLGSSCCETFELLRLVRFLRQHAAPTPIATELHTLIASLDGALGGDRAAFWDASHTAAESYWAATRLGVQGTRIVPPQIERFLAQADDFLTESAHRLRDETTGLFHSYLRYDVTAHSPAPAGKGVRPTAWTRLPLPAYLEGQARAMKTLSDPAERRALYAAVRASELYDQKLGMWRLNASLANEPSAIGRAGIFPAGWLENASIWMHMEYKWLLEIQRAELLEEFCADLRRAAPPFLDPDVYGRSPLEHSSFIVSSAHPESCWHGLGQYARLSGATVEFLSMHMGLTGADRAFRTDAEGHLAFALEPRLPGWLFAETERPCAWLPGGVLPAGGFAFRLLGRIPALILNPARRDTFGAAPARVARYRLTTCAGNTETIEGAALSDAHARALREGAIAHLVVELL